MNDNRYEKQFQFAKKLWENSTGKKYSGSKEDTLEILDKVEQLKSLLAVA